jgi:hypothetical protein
MKEGGRWARYGQPWWPASVSVDEEERWRFREAKRKCGGRCDWHVGPVRSKSTLKISHLSESNGSNIFDDVA